MMQFLLSISIMNCLLYRCGYRPKFYNWLPVFLEKAQTVSNYRCEPKFYYLLAGFLFLLSFCFLWYYSYMSLLYLLGNSLVFFSFFVVCGALGWVLWLKSKKWNGSVSLPSLIGNYQKSYSYISANIFGWMAAR